MGSEPSLRERFVERDTWFRDQLAEHVRAGIRQGSIRADANPNGVAATEHIGRAVVGHGLVHDLAVRYLESPEAAALDGPVRAVTVLVSRALPTGRCSLKTVLIS